MEYEVVREIQNQCPNNQMRDVFFEEVETHDPESYVRGLFHGKVIEVTVEQGTAGGVTVYANTDGITQKFVFTPI